jgi:hypothetical protein
MLRTASKFTLAQWRVFLISLVMLPRVDLRLRRYGFLSTRDWLQSFRSPKSSSSGNDAAVRAKALAGAVSAAARRTIWPVSCLRQALWLEFLLSREGIACAVKLGVKHATPMKLDAHAWVESNGHVLLGGEEVSEHYVELKVEESRHVLR